MITYPYIFFKLRLQQKLPQQKQIDYYRGQDRKKNDGLFFAGSAVLIQFKPTNDLQTKTQRMQSATMDIEFLTYSENVHSDDKRIYKDDPTDHMALVDAVYKALTGYSAKLSDLQALSNLKGTTGDAYIFNSLNRVGFSPDHGSKDYMLTGQTFRCKIWDVSARPEFVSVSPEMLLNKTILV